MMNIRLFIIIMLFSLPVSFSKDSHTIFNFMTISRFLAVENMTGDINAAETAYHFRAPECTQLFLDGVSAANILFFYISYPFIICGSIIEPSYFT